MKHLIYLALLVLSGCTTTTMTGFTDPDYMGKKLDSVVVVTPNINLRYADMLQSKICDAIKTKDVTCYRGLDIFPPTREFTDSEIDTLLGVKHIAGYLLVDYIGSQQSSEIIGTMSFGNSTVFANSIRGSNYAFPLENIDRSDGYELILIDNESMNRVWIASAQTHGEGLANVSNEQFTESIAEKIADTLRESGHI